MGNPYHAVLAAEADEKSVDHAQLETFYVYRSLHSDESWGAATGSRNASSLPNIDFGVTVYAVNEKAAIARGRHLYEKIHKYDSDRDNVRRFAASAVKYVAEHHLKHAGDERLSDGALEAIKQETLKIAISLNKGFAEHFDALDEAYMKGLDGDSSS